MWGESIMAFVLFMLKNGCKNKCIHESMIRQKFMIS